MRHVTILALLAIGACSTTVTETERRWKNIEGHEVFIVTDYGTTVHEEEKCPKIGQPKNPVKRGQVKGGRVMDDQGFFASGPGVHPDLCPTCVK